HSRFSLYPYTTLFRSRLVMTIFVPVVANRSWFPIFTICPYIRWLGSIISILAIPYCVPLKFLHKWHFTKHPPWIFNKEYHIRIRSEEHTSELQSRFDL